ncbi:mechanosensitive ion channel family protein [Christiangramia sabulilitoris]|uniref:Mechanosensitive ion channel family protein n=1 Tax=Christiangramia sabulilitoris TaxID=2583991 RepID=A0A550I6U8_9FLAO|nr:mechanosensitive ion channel domain-containing protein [Christiangramia sabulilitoris]TRO66693.1 mechanosensitive ion channel family protein [Christiangramia sabulilitoris]
MQQLQFKKSLIILLLTCWCQTFGFQENIDSTRSGNLGEELPSKDLILRDTTEFKRPELQDYNAAYYQTGRWNQGIGFPPEKYNLQTPQATLEHFIVNARNNDFEAAAYALNYNLFPDDISIKEAAILAEKLNFILNQRVAISWDDLSDRPDGQIDISTAITKAVAGKPRRSIDFGKVDFEGRDAVFRLQRVKYKDKSPVWLISSQTVENIEQLYAIYGPRKLDEMIPGWLNFELFDIPVWKLLGTLIFILISLLTAKLISFLIKKAFSNTDRYWIKNIASRLASPAGGAVGVLAFYILINNLITFSGPLARGFYAILLVILIIVFTWLVMRVIDYIMDFFAVHKIGDTSKEENVESKRMLTYVSVGRRIFIFIVFIVGASIIFSQFPSLEKLGISLMASAGIATVIVAIAAQSTLGNIIAGIQIALTKPVRIGDSVIINDKFGFVEDLRFTYMVVKTWDLRRIVIPLKTVISESFENLSMTNSQTIGVVEVYADHRIDVSKVRAKFNELVRNSDKWDGDEEKTPSVQVTEMDSKALKLRCLAGGKDFLTSWDLHCELREKIVAYIAELEDGFYLTKERVELENKKNPE